MACNTTSALLYDKIKDDYSFKIYPVIQTVSKYLSQLQEGQANNLFGEKTNVILSEYLKQKKQRQ